MKLLVTLEVEVKDIPPGDPDWDDGMGNTESYSATEEHTADELASGIIAGLAENPECFAGSNIFARYGDVRIISAEMRP